MTAVEGFRELWIVVIVSGAGVVVLGFDGFGEIDGFCFFAHGKSRCSWSAYHIFCFHVISAHSWKFNFVWVEVWFEDDFLAASSKGKSFFFEHVVIDERFDVVDSAIGCFLWTFGEIILWAETHTGAWVFAGDGCSSVGRVGASELMKPYSGWTVWKRGVLEKEKVCLVVERLVGDWLIFWKVAMESRQYFSFIKIIVQISDDLSFRINNYIQRANNVIRVILWFLFCVVLRVFLWRFSVRFCCC